MRWIFLRKGKMRETVLGGVKKRTGKPETFENIWRKCGSLMPAAHGDFILIKLADDGTVIMK